MDIKTWFSTLPYEQQQALLGDTWNLATAAFEAGKAASALNHPKYRHYKGGIYVFVCESKLESDPSVLLTTYRAVEGNDGYWTRRSDVFIEMVEFEGTLVPRFKLIPEGTVACQR